MGWDFWNDDGLSDRARKGLAVGAAGLTVATYSFAPQVGYAASKAADGLLDGTSWDDGALEKGLAFTGKAGDLAFDVGGRVGNLIVPGAGTALTVQKTAIDNLLQGSTEGLDDAARATAGAAGEPMFDRPTDVDDITLESLGMGMGKVALLPGLTGPTATDGKVLAAAANAAGLGVEVPETPWEWPPAVPTVPSKGPIVVTSYMLDFMKHAPRKQTDLYRRDLKANWRTVGLALDDSGREWLHNATTVHTDA